MEMYDKLVKKGKRPHVDWYQVLKDIQDPLLDAEFYSMWSKLCFKSKSRAAYNVLKMHYSTTALERVRWLGESL